MFHPFTNKVTAIFVLLIFQCNMTNAAQVEVVNGRYDGQKYVSISGPIVKGDTKEVERAAKIAIQQGNNGFALLFNSDGGDVTEAIKIGQFARELLATTYVYGNTLYIPGTSEGNELEQSGKEFTQTAFSLHPVKSGKLENWKTMILFAAIAHV